ncbi:DUF1993 domain-containing protein [Ideonella azotifigens]|uniref:DUF1993 family protein n=1 Tax=Ideonella azotifigens TaxID=513160 RepID=A0ABN1KCV4_9BURK|nr:DUF1993 domain-containing protein [Ideonella azotifigens]MCD2343694.1 DUF1993 domain-containing protein [Ideonella azotifigens]
MSITLSSASLPVFKSVLRNLDHCLDKAIANAQARKFDANVFVGMRLAPDMLPLSSQVRIACDASKLGIARVSGLEAPKFDDNETTMPELKQRIHRTLAWLDTVPGSAIDGKEETDVTFPVGKDRTRTMKAEAYLKHWAMPNAFFHVTTAYAILRHNGVDLGKQDYLVGASAAA